MRGTSAQLRRFFDRSEARFGRSIPIRKTVTGIWVPTPLRVIEAALSVLEDLGALGSGASPRPIVDAGTGDGRIPCVLAAYDAGLSAYGVELDPTLYAHAAENLRELESAGMILAGRVRLLEGDYAVPATYAAGGLDFRETGLVLNYPDGNERRLAAFVARHGGVGTTLCLLTHDPEVAVTELDLRVQRDILVKDELPWRLSLYGRAPRRRPSPTGTAPMSA